MSLRQRFQPPQRDTYATANWLFLRLLGVVYLFAFWSLSGQIPGLIGPDGVLPARDYLTEVAAWADADGLGVARYHAAPTLAWLGTSDRFLSELAAAGIVLALLQIAGIMPVAVLPALWLLYLSLTTAGSEFLLFQWDALLLECGLLAIAVAPWRWWHRLSQQAEPLAIGRLLLWALFFRLMFGSGVAKLASGDSTWRDLTAMAFHYGTQPLPTPVAWYAAQLPLWFHKGSAAAVLAIELLLPWGILVSSRARRAVALIAIVFQFLIALTGNYAFFNLLTVVIALTLLNDRSFAWLSGMGGARTGAIGAARPQTAGRRGPAWVAMAIAVLTVPPAGAVFLRQVGPAPAALDEWVSWIRPFRSVNRYGLFAVMTTARPEIEIEGSADGVEWRAYRWRYKPDALTERPRWIAPFQPRLDWQMWFAALGTWEEERWFQAFCQKLLNGSPAVVRLLAHNPFPDAPPRFLRATLYRYRFAPSGTGRWWTRERVRDYSPVLERGAL